MISLNTENEFSDYGVPALISSYRDAGLSGINFPILDQHVPSMHALNDILDSMDQTIHRGGKVLLHCVGGLGRSGVVAACYLVKFCRMDAQSAIAQIRQYRSERAIENSMQEKFISDFAEKVLSGG